jgi:hypothetical protein
VSDERRFRRNVVSNQNAEIARYFHTWRSQKPRSLRLSAINLFDRSYVLRSGDGIGEFARQGSLKKFNMQNLTGGCRAVSGRLSTALTLREMHVSAMESPDLGEHSLEPLAHQHCHTLTGSSRRKERDIAALLIKQVRQRFVLDEIRARILRIDLAEILLVACRDAADLRFAPA